MKCKSCGTEWAISIRGTSKQKYCPVCGTADFLEHSKTAETLEDVIFLIAKDHGLEILGRGDRAVAYFADLAPHLKKERVLLQYLVQCGGNKTLIAALDKSLEEQMACIKRVEKMLADELFLSETAIKKVCGEFWSAIMKIKNPSESGDALLQTLKTEKDEKELSETNNIPARSGEQQKDDCKKNIVRGKREEKPTLMLDHSPEGFLCVDGVYLDNMLTCKDCGQKFVFSAGEQEFLLERGFNIPPKRCKACRDARLAKSRLPREMYTVICGGCGGETKVPFEPKAGLPIYCSDCFAKMRES